MRKPTYVIWWLSARNINDLTSEMIAALPPYLKDECETRFREKGSVPAVWAPRSFGEVKYTMSARNPVHRLLHDARACGLVVAYDDVKKLPVANCIGVLTDLDCLLLPVCPVCGGIASAAQQLIIARGIVVVGFEDDDVYKCDDCLNPTDADLPFLFSLSDRESDPTSAIAAHRPQDPP